MIMDTVERSRTEDIQNSGLSDTEEMEENDDGEESDSQEVYFVPQNQYNFTTRRRIEDTEDFSGSEHTEVVSPLSVTSATDEDSETGTVSQNSERSVPRYRRIHYDEDLSDSSVESMPDSESDVDISVVSNVEEVRREFHDVAPNGDNAEFSDVDVEEMDMNEPIIEESNQEVQVINEATKTRESVVEMPSTSKTSPEKNPEAASARPRKDDEAEYCPICFEVWSNSGKHRIVSLKCGHLFGKDCIEKWLKGPRKMCPQCNTRAVMKDVRVIYAKTVKVEDTTERERLMQEIEKLRREKETFAQLNSRQQMKISQDYRYIEDLQNQLRMMKESLGNYSSMNTDSAGSSTRKFRLSLLHTLDLNIKNGSCRVMAFNEWMNMLIVSYPSQIEVFPGFGIKKINTLDFKIGNYVQLHSKQIRDLSFNPLKKDLLLSVGFDKVAKVTNVSSNATVVSYNTNSVLWCCCWNTENTSEFFVGTSTGVIYHFDTVANTNEPINTYQVRGTGPVVSIVYVPQEPSKEFYHCGLLVTRLNSISFEEILGSEIKSHNLPIEGTFTHTAFDPISMHLLITCRPTDRHLHVRHRLYELKSNVVSGNYVTAQEVHSFQGSTTMKVIARTCLSSQNVDESLMVLFSEESTGSVKVCDVRTTSPTQTIKSGVNIIDILPVKGSDGNYIAMLSDRCVKIFKWIPDLRT